MATKFEIIKAGERIETCSDMLPNGFRCTRAGEFYVLDGEAGNKARQVCRTHAILTRAKEQEAARQSDPYGSIAVLSNNEVLLEKLNAETPEEQALNEKLKKEKQSEVATNEQPNSAEPGAQS